MISLDYINYWRFLRRVLLLAVVLILLVACSAQVKAETESISAEAETAVQVSMQEAGITEDNFSAVSVQLKAVARAEGRSIADRMMHSAMCAAITESENAITASVSEGGLNVIVVPEENPAVSLDKVLLLGFIVFVLLLMAVSAYTRSQKVRRTVYKPMRTVPVQTNYYAKYSTRCYAFTKGFK